ncbi:MAG: hypothetical protein Unbinned1473contig1000_43 [Prokaryotic dsDNA virus sp.]|nr:MAG: hypothetical protein Unbinned1473contig1000_43 [Prokaryotic dsDNA virus sp.]
MNQRTKRYHIGMIAGAIMRKQSEYKTEDFTVGLPSPQKMGTYIQRLTYARLKAEEIIDNL